MYKVISFSLWGDNTRYTLGAIQNASLAKIVYPEWICRYYVDKTVPDYIINILSEFNNTEIILMDDCGNWTSMFWRFLAAGDSDVDVMISRDCDSRLWFREKLAVDQWLDSDKDFHIMRDHTSHSTEILGGMWGCRNGILKDICEWIENYKKGDFWQVDQNFLREIVYPIVKENSFVHDEFLDYFDNKSPFLDRRDEKHFIGQAYSGCGRILDAEEYFQDFIRRYIYE